MRQKDSTETTSKPTPTWVISAVSGFFGLFYAYTVWNALGFLIKRASYDLGLNGWGWFILIMAVIFPIIVFALVVGIGYKRRLGIFALMLLTGLALVSVFWLNIVAYHEANYLSLFGGL